MGYLLGVVAFVAALVLSVMLHEAGHLLTAKRFGMKATQFFVGFGPTLWATRRGETEYGVKAILLGGFVRIVGYTALEEVDETDRPRAFYRQPAGRRAAVVGSGVVVNFAVAFLLLTGLAMTIGVRDPGVATTTVQKVSPCVPEALGKRCAEDSPPSPARQAGIRAGDRVVAFAGVLVADWTELRERIRATRPGQTVPVVIERAGRRFTVRVVLAEVGGEPFFGMRAQIVTAGYDRLGPLEAAGSAFEGIGRLVGEMGRALAALPAAVPELFSPERAETPGGRVGSVIGAGQVSGEIFSADVSWKDKIGAYLTLIASINVFLGALNVLPLLPLDGGHLAVIGYERLRARLARARGLPDPGPVDLTRLLPIAYLVIVLLVGLSALLILADLINPLGVP